MNINVSFTLFNLILNFAVILFFVETHGVQGGFHYRKNKLLHRMDGIHKKVLRLTASGEQDDTNKVKEFHRDLKDNAKGLTDTGIQVTDNEKGLTDGKHVTDNEKGLTDGKLVTVNEKGLTDGKLVTDNGKGLTDGKHLTDNEKGLTDGKYVTDNEKGLTDGKHVTDNEKGLTDENHVTDNEKELTDGNRKTDSEKRLTDKELTDSGKKTGSEIDTIKLDHEKNCWITLNADELHDQMDKLEEHYSGAAEEFKTSLRVDDFDKEMLDVLLQTRGTAIREVYRSSDPKLIPAGINLGGHGIIRLPKLLLFFHRMKLRNSTEFHIESLHTDVENMKLDVKISMNTLRLMGNYFRSATVTDPFVLIYIPNHGTLEIVLDQVEYTMEGRLRVLQDRLNLEIIVSHFDIKNITLLYQNNVTDQRSIDLRERHIYDFLDRMKRDFNYWMRDFLNDYLMYHKLPNPVPPQFLEFDKKKSLALNKYFDGAIVNLKQRIHDLGAEAVAVPKFKIITVDGLEFKIFFGALRGLDTLFRRSIATTVKKDFMRSVDALVSFSDLKVEYQYSVRLPQSGMVNGSIIFNADEYTVHMKLNLVKSPETVEIQIDSAEYMRPPSMTVEGAAGRMIANFKFVLEQHIHTIMINTVHYAVQGLETLTKCDPYFTRYVPNKEITPKVDHDGSLKIYNTYCIFSLCTNG